jgi:hypothetical protein
METAIVIPLFMVLIGGIMLSGQLIYDKQQLVIADRYVAWNYGNRFAQNYGDVQARFFDETTPDTVKQPVVGVEVSSSPWWHEVHGSVELSATNPIWTAGWFLPSYYMQQASEAGAGGGMPASFTLHGRDLANGLSGGHTVVMRQTPTDSRNATVSPNDGDSTISYGSIYYENWPAQ